MNTKRQTSPRPRNDQAMSTEEFYRELFAKNNRPAPSASRAPGPPINPDNPEEISTEEFFRQLFARDPDEAQQGPPAPAGSRRSAFVARGSGVEDGRPNLLYPTYAPVQNGKDDTPPKNVMYAARDDGEGKEARQAGDKPAGWGLENSNGPEVGSPEWHNIRNRHANMVLYTPNAGEAVDRATSEGLQRMAVQAGHDITVTGGKESGRGHQNGSAHETGQAADLSYEKNQKLTEEKFRKLYGEAFDQKSSLALIEGNHFHIQTRPGKGGAIGIRRWPSK